MEQPNALANLENPPSPSWQKIKNACTEARRARLQYIWIDTCCIDKFSSAEPQESINSMFQWYALAEVCYAYLCDLEPDLSANLVGTPSMVDPTDVTKHRWFTRGWTLQELLAPPKIRFFDRTWTFRFTRESQVSNIKSVISIDSHLLGRTEKWDVEFSQRVLRGISVAQRMSWAVGRQTTRVEDQAYSLLGLFDVNMPLLYGEGSKAFTRLQCEIMRINDDCTLLTWGFRPPVISMGPKAGPDPGILVYCNEIVGALAVSPRDFQSTVPPDLLEPCRVHGELKRPSFSPNQRGISINLALKQDPAFPSVWYGILGTEFPIGEGKAVALPLRRGPSCGGELGEDEFFRSSWSGPVRVPRSFLDDAKWSLVTICSPSNIKQKRFDRNRLMFPTLRIALATTIQNPCRFSHAHKVGVSNIYPGDYPYPVMFKFYFDKIPEVMSLEPVPQFHRTDLRWWFVRVMDGINDETLGTLVFHIGCVECWEYRVLLFLRFYDHEVIRGKLISMKDIEFGDQACVSEQQRRIMHGSQGWVDAVPKSTSARGFYNLTFEEQRESQQGTTSAETMVAVLAPTEHPTTVPYVKIIRAMKS